MSIMIIKKFWRITRVAVSRGIRSINAKSIVLSRSDSSITKTVNSLDRKCQRSAYNSFASDRVVDRNRKPYRVQKPRGMMRRSKLDSWCTIAWSASIRGFLIIYLSISSPFQQGYNRLFADDLKQKSL